MTRGVPCKAFPPRQQCPYQQKTDRLETAIAQRHQPISLQKQQLHIRQGHPPRINENNRLLVHVA